MTRFYRALIALCVSGSLLFPTRGEAALVTDVADAADGDDPLDVNIDLSWERWQKRSKITREHFDGTRTFNATEMHHQRWTHTLTPAIAIGLFHDLELHARIPYAIHDEQYWDYATVDGNYVKPVSTLETNTLDANGNATAASARPLLPSPGRVYRGGFLDPTIGLAWGLFNGEREKRLPETWFPHKVRTATLVLGFDYTMPIIDAADPTKADPRSPMPNTTLPLGTGSHRFDWWVAMSKRLGIVEPFMRLHYTLPVASKQAYDNCQIVGKDDDFMVMSQTGQELCSNGDPFWAGKTGTQLPHVGGMLVGTEIIPIEEKDGLRLSIGLQVAADFVSKGRQFSEMSDALQKLTYTDQHFSLDGRLTFDLRFSKWVHFVTFLSLGTDTPHFITSESVGKDRYGEDGEGSAPDGTVTIHSSEMNPNYDFRLDQPGRRLRVTDVSVFGLSTMLQVNF